MTVVPGPEDEFWRAVRAENAALTPEERVEYAGDESLLDDLADPVDDAISEHGDAF